LSQAKGEEDYNYIGESILLLKDGDGDVDLTEGDTADDELGERRRALEGRDGATRITGLSADVVAMRRASISFLFLRQPREQSPRPHTYY